MTETKAKIGRPSIYTPQLADELCARLVGADKGEARSLVSVCRDDDMPGFRTVMSWLDDERYEEFQHKYARARDHRTEALFEEMTDIARHSNDATKIKIRETEKGSMRDEEIGDNVQRSALLIDTVKWQLARMSPKKYGDKLQVDTKTDITHHYTDDDTAILERYAKQQAAIKNRKPQPQEESDG